MTRNSSGHPRCFCPGRRFFHSGSLMLLMAALLSGSVQAQDKFYPLEAADTSSPRATLASFLKGMRGIYDIPRAEQLRSHPSSESAARGRQVLRCLDVSQLAEAVRKSRQRESAVCLKEVLDRIPLPPESEWPDEEEMADRESTRWTIPHTEIVITKMETGPRIDEYLFSADTVDRAPEFLEVVGDRDYIDRPWVTPGFYAYFISQPGWMIPDDWLPEWSRTRWNGQAIWQWFGLVIVLLTSLIVMATIYLTGRRLSRRQLRSGRATYFATLAFPTTALLIPMGALYLVTEQLQIYGQLMVVLSFSLHLVFLVALIVLVISIGNRLAELLIAAPWIQPAGLDAQLIRLTCRAISIGGAAVVALEGGQSLGIPLTTLLAGASVSGLAFALAAQDSLKNILGSMMIMLDKPFRIGERIVAQGYDGVVEDIGLRSTRLRLLSGHQVTIPNEVLARTEIENIGRRPYIRRAATIELPSSTPAGKVQRALEILRSILKDHEGMHEDLPPRVYLRDVNEGSIGIFVVYWYHPPEYWDYLAFSERVTMQMSEQFEAEDIPFAVPVLAVQPALTGESPQQTSPAT